MIEFKQNSETGGKVFAYENGKKVGEIITMGDLLFEENEKADKEREGRRKTTQNAESRNDEQDNKEQGQYLI